MVTGEPWLNGGRREWAFELWIGIVCMNSDKFFLVLDTSICIVQYLPESESLATAYQAVYPTCVFIS
jgi:hypothetical protein